MVFGIFKKKKKTVEDYLKDKNVMELIFRITSYNVCYTKLLREKLGFDDVCGVVPVHAAAGSIGAILTGIFGMTMFGGLGGVSLTQQVIAVIICAVYGTSLGFILGIV